MRTVGSATFAFICTLPSDLSIRSSSGPTIIVNEGGNKTTAQVVASLTREITSVYPQTSAIIWMAGEQIGAIEPIVLQGLGVQIVLSPMYDFFFSLLSFLSIYDVCVFFCFCFHLPTFQVFASYFGADSPFALDYFYPT
jgi:hypothetical protein